MPDYTVNPDYNVVNAMLPELMLYAAYTSIIYTCADISTMHVVEVLEGIIDSSYTVL